MERVYGIGIDQIEINRVLESCKKKSFIDKIYTKDEIDYCKKHKNSFAKNFAGKEAVVKALGTGFSGITPIDIEILREHSGAPFVNIVGNLKEKCLEKNIIKIHISLSDSKEFAVAYAMAVCEEE